MGNMQEAAGARDLGSQLSDRQANEASVSMRKWLVIAQLLLFRGNCILFSRTIPSLQVAPSFACSVASLSLYPDH